MKKISRILAAIDFSKPARGAFEFALASSQAHGAELFVIQAVPLEQAFGWRAGERRRLAETLRRKADRANVTFRDRVQQGDPADTILLHASSVRADLIVAGTHQRRGFARLTGGSIAERLAAKATVPVLLVPPHWSQGAIRPFTHPVAAVDLNDGSRRVVEEALRLAGAPAGRLTVAHVVPGGGSGASLHSSPPGQAEYQGRLLEEARRRLPAAIQLARPADVAIETRLLVGDVTAEITSLVESVGADLLIVGVPTRGPLSRALFGATVSRLLRKSRVPVLAVPELEAAVERRDSTSLQLAA